MPVDSPDWVRQIIAETNVDGALSANVSKIGAFKAPLAYYDGTYSATSVYTTIETGEVPDGEVWHVTYTDFINYVHDTPEIQGSILTNPAKFTVEDMYYAWVSAITAATIYVVPFQFYLFPGQKIQFGVTTVVGDEVWMGWIGEKYSI